MTNKSYDYAEATHVQAVAANMTCRVEGGKTYDQVYNNDRGASPQGKTAW